MEGATQKEVAQRLKSIEGHIRGIQRIVEAERPCVAIIHQIQAAQGSLKQAQMLLLRHHLQVCLCNLAEQDPEQGDLLRQELTLLFERSH